MMKAKRKARIPPGLTSTTTPAGIAANDPDAVVGVRFRGNIVGPKCPPNEHGLVIDAEIRDLIEPLTPHERGTLKTNLERDGCLDPLKGWKETGILLDGHNRKEISEAHTPEPVPFAVEWLSFPDRRAAIAWVLGNQLGRRNITPEHRNYLIGKRLEHESRPHGGNRKSKAQNEPLIGDTASRIAKETGKSRETVKRNGVFSKAVDRLDNVGVPRKELLSGKKKMSPTAAKAVAGMKPRQVHSVATKLRNGSAKSVDEAVGFTIQMPAKATKPAPPAGPNPLQEFTDTVLNRLAEIKSIGSEPVKRLVGELVNFVKSWP